MLLNVNNFFVFSFYSMFDVFRGFQIFIGEASEFAVMSDRSYILDTGRYTNMDISGKFVS